MTRLTGRSAPSAAAPGVDHFSATGRCQSTQLSSNCAASASESESTESSDSEPHDVYSSSLSVFVPLTCGGRESGMEWHLKHLLHCEYSWLDPWYSFGLMCSQLPVAGFHPHPTARPVASRRCIRNFPDCALAFRITRDNGLFESVS